MPGFSLPDSQGVMRGLDADTCRAVAAAALGDVSKVKFVRDHDQNRFTALQSGEVDVLSRSTTWTLGREANLGLEFAWVNYYDGTGFLVKKSSGVKSAKEMDGATICVQPGTSTELAINDYFRVNKMKFTPILIQDLRKSRAPSSPAGATPTRPTPRRSPTPLQPGAEGRRPCCCRKSSARSRWARWCARATTSGSTWCAGPLHRHDHRRGERHHQRERRELLNSTDPDIRRLLGVEGDMGKALGVDNKWAYNVIKQVGNFGEMWDRNITPMGVPRGINKCGTRAACGTRRRSADRRLTGAPSTGAARVLADRFRVSRLFTRLAQFRSQGARIAPPWNSESERKCPAPRYRIRRRLLLRRPRR